MARWYSERKKEHFYKEAKRVGYRSRSAYKLKQIQEKFKILKEGNIVVDLGAAPGGWSQVAKEIVGEKGTVIGIDLSPKMIEKAIINHKLSQETSNLLLFPISVRELNILQP